MPEGRRKSRTLRRVFVRLPSGKTTTQYVRRKPAKPQCANCGKYLHGVARALPTNISKLSKSQRRPERPYGGVLCSSCSRNTITNRFRGLFSISLKK